VALFASGRAVAALQPETGQVVAEPFREPVLRGVAFLAIRGAELVEVRVGMAFCAIRPQSRKDSLGLVAGVAGNL
jgi:hypothetical protein